MSRRWPKEKKRTCPECGSSLARANGRVQKGKDGVKRVYQGYWCKVCICYQYFIDGVWEGSVHYPEEEEE